MSCLLQNDLAAYPSTIRSQISVKKIDLAGYNRWIRSQIFEQGEENGPKGYCRRYFYLSWIQPLKTKGIDGGKNYWQTKSKTSSALSWAGYTFETISLKHVDQIKDALDLHGIPCELGSWRYIPKKGVLEQGAQIDLLFDRDDGKRSRDEDQD